MKGQSNKDNYVPETNNVTQSTEQMSKSQLKFVFLMVKSANNAIQIPVPIDYSVIKYVYILSCYQKAGV